jgi:hypothetical protein
MKPTPITTLPHEDGATAAAIATWPGDRPSIMKLLECRLLHRADWQYLGTRNDETIAPWPVDSYRCERCERAWDKVS